jgi:hypothetical protein
MAMLPLWRQATPGTWALARSESAADSWCRDLEEPCLSLRFLHPRTRSASEDRRCLTIHIVRFSRLDQVA